MSKELCPNTGDLVEERINFILTQYRESPKLLHLLRTYLGSVEETALKICNLPDYFDINSAVGDQLTIVGKWLGWPRCHCVCDVQPVFGFDCDGFISDYPVAGFCDNTVTWSDCGQFGLGDICINDDELYRKFLKVRIYQMLGLFDIDNLNTCLRILFGETSFVISSGFGRVVITPGRDLTDVEIALLQLYPRILPIALGIEVRFHFDKPEVFGFGDGWGGFCEDWQNSINIVSFNENTEANMQTENQLNITTGVMTRDAPWLCEIDVRPYDC